MFPHLGAGAGQGVEDAYLLAQLLSHSQTTVNNVEVRSHFCCIYHSKALDIYIPFGRRFCKFIPISVDLARNTFKISVSEPDKYIRGEDRMASRKRG